MSTPAGPGARATAPAPTVPTGTTGTTGTGAPAHAPAAAMKNANRPAPRRRTSTPSRLRRLGALGLLAGCLSGVSGAAGVFGAQDAARGAATAANRSVALQLANVHATQARAQGRQIILGGGPAPAASVKKLTDEVEAAEAALVRAGPGPEDTTAAAAALSRYPTVVVRAVSASSTPDDLAAVTTVESGWSGLSTAVKNESARAGTGSVGVRYGLGVAGAALGLIALGGCAFWLARRTRRVINPPLAAGVALGLLVLVGTASACGAVTATTSVTTLSDTRTLALDAATLRADRLSRLGSTDRTPVATAADAVEQDLARLPANDPAKGPGQTYVAAEKAGLAAGDTQSARDSASLYEALRTTLTDRLTSPTVQAPVGSGSLPWWLLLGGLAAGGLAAAGAARAAKEYR